MNPKFSKERFLSFLFTIGYKLRLQSVTESTGVFSIEGESSTPQFFFQDKSQ